MRGISLIACNVAVALNLKGYFLGLRFPGVHDSGSQAIAVLSSEITAKVLMGLRPLRHMAMICLTTLGAVHCRIYGAL